MDPADRELGGHGCNHRIETSLLPLKKRASNYSGDGRMSAGDPSASPSKRKRMDTTGALLEAPVPRQRRRPVPAAASRELAVDRPAPAACSPNPAAKGKALLSESDEEKKRLSKGKWLAKEENSSLVTTRPPPVKKLMHDGIRSFVPQQLRDEHRRHAAVPLHLHGASPALSPALERRLAELGATRPWLVHSKWLEKSDVDENQNRLLVSCKRGGRGTAGSPITRCFTRAELARVHNKLVGLGVTAFDRDGSAYALTSKFLDSNSGYRFITEWKEFLIQNGLNLNSQEDKVWKRHVEVELWAFRSHQLPLQPQLDAEGNKVTVKTEDEDGKTVWVVQQISHHLDPDGALGLVLLHHEHASRRVVLKSEEEDDDEWKQGPLSLRPVAGKKGKQQSGKKRGASASDAPVALPAPASEQEGARWSEPTLSLCAAIGLAKLRQAMLKRWKEYADQGGHSAKGFSNDVAKSPALADSSKKERGASSLTVDSSGKGNVAFGSCGRKTSTEDMTQAAKVKG